MSVKHRYKTFMDFNFMYFICSSLTFTIMRFFSFLSHTLAPSLSLSRSLSKKIANKFTSNAENEDAPIVTIGLRRK